MYKISLPDRQGDLVQKKQIRRVDDHHQVIGYEREPACPDLKTVTLEEAETKVF